jgi:tRNA-specific 2-thiouridylase
VQIRHRHPAGLATVTAAGGAARVEFDSPQRAITPGQAAVFYDGDEVIGGGWIDETGAGGDRRFL